MTFDAHSLPETIPDDLGAIQLAGVRFLGGIDLELDFGQVRGLRRALKLKRTEPQEVPVSRENYLTLRAILTSRFAPFFEPILVQNQAPIRAPMLDGSGVATHVDDALE